MLLNLRNDQRRYIDKIYLYVKNSFESNYKLLIIGKEKVGIKKLKNLKAFIDYSQTVDDTYENLQDHDPTKNSDWWYDSRFEYED